MRIAMRAALGLAVVAAVVGAAWVLGTKWFSPPEDKINQAFPLSNEARFSIDSLEQWSATTARDAGFQGEVRRRLRIRAQTCARGYRPSLWASAADIRSHIEDPGCFAEQDASLTSWLEWIELGLIAGLPPLRSMPSELPESIALSDIVTDVSVAENAGLLLAVTRTGFEIRDLSDAGLVWKNELEGRRGGHGSSAMSPNGRIAAVWDGVGMVLWDIPSRAQLMRIPGARPGTLRWLDNRTISYSDKSRSSLRFVDLTYGNSISMDDPQGRALAVFAAKERENEYVVLGRESISRVALQRDWQGLSVNLKDERRHESSLLTRSTGRMVTTADGREVMGAGAGLWRLSLDSLELKVSEFKPLSVVDAAATSDPDAMLIRVLLPRGYEQRRRLLVYSWPERLVRPVLSESLHEGQVQFDSALNRNLVVNRDRVSFVDEWPTGPAMAPDAYMTMARSEEEVRQTQQTQRRPATIPYYPPGMAGMRLGATEPSPVLAALANGARVESVGVYEAESTAQRPPGAHPVGNITVRVRPAKEPIVLVISSYEPVRWHLQVSKGAKLAAILLFGNTSSEVVGNGNVRVVRPSSRYAYRQGSVDYQRLDYEVRSTLGKGIDVFQGQYRGKVFDVGGG